MSHGGAASPVPIRLFVITPPESLPGETLAVTGILRRTAATVHLRKPAQDASRLARYLASIPADLHGRIMVHDTPCLADRFGLMGVHFSERCRRQDPAAIIRLRQARPDGRISTAVHRIADIPPADGLFDYLLLSPVFDSISKKGYRGAFDPAGLECLLRQTRHTLVALGGIDAPRIAVAARLGFTGVAVLGAVWQAPSAAEAADKLWQRCQAIACVPQTGSAAAGANRPSATVRIR